ncbi:M20/M25/M40 family metallo-hydrolase [Caenimonas aquaedulcis]|uniref:Carboxypeptidase Q n=1 Tax=Caenimonas aquaedulcis TaxID=2793270 RepID=A0A931H1Z7_9BURK|nr:M20/M25/M40 family metallo-hydrolase [Caenimonas aquaedulcis]MBG9387055.1 M20/M25/M40 family metallo-hydrolase [Caenimonas aquaedulcis]
MHSLYTGQRRRFVQSLLAAPLLSALPLRTFAQGAAPFTEDDLAHAAALRDQALRSNLAFNLMASLVSEVGPRPAGSPGYDKATQWALARLAALGFSNVRAEPVALSAWQRGATTLDVLAPQARRLIVAALGNSVGTPAGGVEGEIAYYPDFAALRDDTTDRARGRIAFIDRQLGRERGTGSYGEAIRGRVLGAVEAGKRGALAVVIRSLGTDTDRIAHTGSMRYDDDVAKIPAVAVSTMDAQWIAERAANGRPVRVRLAMAATAQVPALANNVIGEVPGTGLAGEIVLLGAHLDSWDITPGAQDDAAGVGIVMAAAKAIIEAGRKPRRTVRVVLFANEENGFDGAKAYAARYKDVPHQLMGESDLGAGRIWRLRSRVAESALPAIAAMGRVLQPLGIATEGNDGSPEPDISALMDLNRWPALELSQDATKYFDVHHTINDTVDRVDPATMPQNAAAWAAVAWLAAQKEGGFGPIAGT